MKLAEALSSSPLAWAERGSGDTRALVHRSRCGYHLTRSTPEAEARSHAQDWVFPSRSDLLVFAHAERVCGARPRCRRLARGLWVGLILH